MRWFILYGQVYYDEADVHLKVMLYVILAGDSTVRNHSRIMAIHS